MACAFKVPRERDLCGGGGRRLRGTAVWTLLHHALRRDLRPLIPTTTPIIRRTFRSLNMAPTQMQAVVVVEGKKAEVQTVDIPKLEAGEVLVKVRLPSFSCLWVSCSHFISYRSLLSASTQLTGRCVVSRCFAASHRSSFSSSSQHVAFLAPPGSLVGCDFVGTVVDANGQDFKDGARVASFVHGGKYPDRGSFAEYTKATASALVKVPDETPDEVAATIGVAGLTAIQVSKKKRCVLYAVADLQHFVGPLQPPRVP